jgi:hypothetical protein
MNLEKEVHECSNTSDAKCNVIKVFNMLVDKSILSKILEYLTGTGKIGSIRLGMRCDRID